MRVNNFYMNQLDGIPLLTVEEERELVKKSWEGDKKARDKLVTSNLRFVVKIANQYKNQGLAEEDLICEGNAGLLIAAKKFDPSKENRFITYAVWWIKQSIQKALYETGRNVKIPLNRKDEFKSSKWKMASLDAVYTDEENGDSLGTSLIDERFFSPEDDFIRKEQKKAVVKELSKLSKKEQTVLKMRYGLAENEEMSLQQISKVLDYTKEGIRKIEQRGLKNLRDALGGAA